MKPRFFVLDYRDFMGRISIYFPAGLWTNEVETNRLGTRFTTFTVIKIPQLAILPHLDIPDYLLRELLWPSHIPLPSLENPTGDEPDAGEAMSSLVKVPFPLPDFFPHYTHDPRHMLCQSCLSHVSMSKFWSWWEIQRRLPPMSAPDQPDCERGFDCNEQDLIDHAEMYNVSGFFDKLRLLALSC